MKVFEVEVEEEGFSEDEKSKLFKSEGKGRSSASRMGCSDISYVSDTFSKPGRGVFPAEPLKAVTIFCRGVRLGKYICKFRLELGVL
jgi:hypothetical protein